jgi:response regulator of citrate/malate metabolism
MILVKEQHKTKAQIARASGLSHATVRHYLESFLPFPLTKVQS